MLDYALPLPESVLVAAAIGGVPAVAAADSSSVGPAASPAALPAVLPSSPALAALVAVLVAALPVALASAVGAGVSSGSSHHSRTVGSSARPDDAIMLSVGWHATPRTTPEVLRNGQGSRAERQR